jgi:hypothetical protein
MLSLPYTALFPSQNPSYPRNSKKPESGSDDHNIIVRGLLSTGMAFHGQNLGALQWVNQYYIGRSLQLYGTYVIVVLDNRLALWRPNRTEQGTKHSGRFYV